MTEFSDVQANMLATFSYSCDGEMHAPQLEIIMAHL